MSSDINVQTFSGKVNITSNLLVGSSHLFVDTINNRVGLVTTTPDAGIHVNSNAYVHTDFRVGSGIVMNDTSGRITAGSFVGDGSGITSVNSDSGSWVNGTNSNVHLATSTDNVGIGTTSPEAQLHIGPKDNDHIYLASSNNDYGWKIDTDDQGAGEVPFRIIKRLNDVDTTVLTIKNQDGNVGIGTTIPGRPLDVQFTGDTGIRAKNTGSSHASVYIDSASGYSYLRFESSGAAKFWLQSTPTGDLAFRPSGGGHVMDIKNNGNVGIGVSDPDSKLEVRGNIRASFSDTNHGMFIDAGGTILRNYGGGGAGFHFTTNAIWPTNYLGSYSAGGIDLGSSTYRWNNIYTEALNASGTIDSTGIITCNANKMVITGSSPTLYLRDSNARTGMIHQNDNRMYFLTGPANSDSWAQTANSRWPLYLQMDTNEAVFGGNIDAAVGTVTASTFSATSQLYLGTSASIRQTSTSWTGDPGSGVGKIEYHSNRWYVVAGSNSTELLRVRRNNTDKFAIDNNGSISLGIVPAARISGTVASATTAGSVTGKSQISKSAHSSGANDYHLELYSGNTGSSSNEVSIRFHQGSVWWGQLRFRSSQFYFTSGSDNSLYPINTGSIYNSGSLESDGRIYADNGCHVRGDWLRVNGVNGIYFESYGGGWNMTDSTWIRSYGTKKLHVNNEINTNNRVYASGYVYVNMNARYYSMVSGNAITTANRPISVYAEHHMRCSELQVTSDRRIKTDIVDVDDGSALELLRKIKPKTYGYVDTVEKGTKHVYGFIAQEIKELIPEAIDVSEGDLPNIYKYATIDIQANSITIKDFDTSNLNQTESVIYIDQDDQRKTLKIKSILNSTQLEIEEDLEKLVETFKTSKLEDYEFTGEIFIWGQHVNDFHHLQKSAIFTVATAALQEVDRQLQAEKAKTLELQQKLEILEMSHGALIQRIEALEKL